MRKIEKDVREPVIGQLIKIVVRMISEDEIEILGGCLKFHPLNGYKVNRMLKEHLKAR